MSAVIKTLNFSQEKMLFYGNVNMYIPEIS